MPRVDLGLLLEGGLVEAPEPLLEGLEVARLCVGCLGEKPGTADPTDEPTAVVVAAETLLATAAE